MYLIAFLFPLIGLIWGLVKNEKGVTVFSVVLIVIELFIWFISTIRDRLWYADEPTPSAFAESMMKFSKYGGFVIGCIALAFAAWMYF